MVTWLRKALLISAWLPLVATGAESLSRPCMGPVKPLLDRRIELGSSAITIPVPDGQGSDLLVQVVEQGIDVALSASGLRAESPLARQGLHRLVLPRASGGSITLASVDRPGLRGSVRLLISPLSAQPQGCERLAREFAHADAAFAAAQLIRRAADREGANPEASALAAETAYRRIALSEAAAPWAAERGQAELAAAVISYQLNHWRDSATWAGRAAASFAAADAAYLRARARFVEASSWLERPVADDSLERARTVFGELAAFHRARGETLDEAMQINSIGIAYFYQARFEEALPQYSAAQAMFQQLGEMQRVGLALQNRALCEWGLGHIRRALPLFDQALAAFDRKLEPRHYILALTNAAQAQQVAGNTDRSLRLLGEALDLAAGVHSTYYRARSLFGLGTTYYAIGDRALARQYLLDAVRIWTPDLDERGRLSALRSLAVIAAETGDLPLADRYNTEALDLARSNIARDRIRLKMAETALARGDLLAAERIIEPLAGDRPSAERLTQADARVARAKLRLRRNQLAGAEQDLRQAIATFAALEALSEEFAARVELARVLRLTGRELLAARELGAALERSEELRTQSENPEYRASVAGMIRPALDLRLALLWTEHTRLASKDPAAAAKAALTALEVSDAVRGRAFEQYRSQRLDAGDAALARLLDQRAELLRSLSERRYYLDTRQDRGGIDDPRATSIRDEIRRLRLSLGVVDADIATRSRRQDAAPTTADGLLRRFSTGAPAGVEYWIGSPASYAWVIREGKLSWVRLADGPLITQAARRLHASLVQFATVPRRERLAAAEELHRLVIAPLAQPLAGASRWIVAPDGPLHFVPFAALRDPGQDRYLVDSVVVAMTPALRHAPATSSAARSNATPGRLLLVSDPVYQANDARLSQDANLATRGRPGARQWARIAATAREARGIRGLFPAAQVDELQGITANRAAFLGRDLGQYRFVHVAAHGLMDAEIPALSALVLGAYDERGGVADQEVRAGDLLAARLAADLVVLSACDTSLGPSFPDEGPMGLRYVVLARGARAVVSSLWSAVDEMSADLMTDMYARMLGRADPVELALTQAMRALLAKSPNLDPAFWAPYSVYLVDQ